MRVIINSEDPEPDLVRQTVEILRAGGVIAYPTDTVYGLGCDIFSKNAVQKIYRLKGRDFKKPLSFMCADLQEISQYAQISDFAYRVMKHCLPGPYTFILPSKHNVPKSFLPKQQTVGVRIPNNALCLALTKELGRPIITTSANLSDQPSLGDAKEIEKTFNHGLDLILDSGILNQEASTIISLIDDNPQILRPGSGSVDWLKNF